jgi:hypothetical protein
VRTILQAFAPVDGLGSQLNDLEDFMQESDSQDLLFSLVNYHRFHSWLVSVGRCITVMKARVHGRNQISSHLGLIRSNEITQSILKDEETMVHGVLEIIASGDGGVYDLQADDADSFLNLLQEVRKLSFFSSKISKYVAFGPFWTIPSLGGDRNSASLSQPQYRERRAICTTDALRPISSEQCSSFFTLPQTNIPLNGPDD